MASDAAERAAYSAQLRAERDASEVVLMSFAGGLLLGILGMVPRWWQQRREARRNAKLSESPIAQATPAADETLTHGL